MPAAPNRQKAYYPPWLRALRILYRTLVVLSAIVVALFLLYSVVVRPPAKAAPPLASPPPKTVITDNPDTPEDESGQPSADALQRKEDYYTFLLMGCDDGNGNADTIMVASYDVANKKVGVISIPRDTLVNVKRTIKKINAAYGSGGVEQVLDEVSTLVGFPVDHYIKVDLRAFKAIVDAVDGVDFYVPVTMNYEDPLQNLSIHFKEGMQHLNGSQALLVARFRSGYSNADIGRISTQQKLLTALAKKVLSWNSVPKINQFIDIFAEYVETDLTVGNLAYFAVEALSLDTTAGLSLATLPGDGLVTYKGIDYYYELFPEETLELINTHINPYTTDITQEMSGIFQVP